YLDNLVATIDKEKIHELTSENEIDGENATEEHLNKPKINIFENIIRIILYKEYDNLIVKDGTLYRYSDDHNDHIHSSIFNEHLGYSKTSSKISERFYRPFLKDDIKNCIKLCDVYQKVKANQREHKAELLYLTPCRPNQLIRTDLAGPFKSTSIGNQYIQVVICHFTKFVEFYPLKNSKTHSIADKIVNEWCCRYGVPENIRGLKTKPYHPQCNGQSERTIQTLKTMIKSY
ncbi:unnamed protein product, partial [Brachionus calyciflorus]